MTAPRGFVSLGLILLLVLGLAVIGGAGWRYTQQNVAINEPPVDSWETYTNTEQGYTLQYPSGYSVEGTTSENIFLMPAGGGPSVQLMVARDDYCYLGLCEKFMAAKEQVELNGLTWEYLGQTTYSEGAGIPHESYRIRHGSRTIYVQSKAGAGAREFTESVLETFTFITSMSESSGETLSALPLTASATTGLAPFTVTFTKKTEVSGHVDFGDGSRGCEWRAEIPNCFAGGTAHLFTHTYEKPGTYRVTLTSGATVTTIATIAVTGSNQVPVIHTFTGPTSLKVGDTGTWVVGASDAEKQPLTFVILWGDEIPLSSQYQDVAHPINRAKLGEGEIFTSTSVNHTYKQQGAYTIKLYVFEPDVNRFGDMKTLIVTVTN
jgi:PKD repeat protein